MAKEYILAIDEGTTGATALIVDKTLRLVGKANQEFAQVFPKPGWVEHDGDAIWRAIEGSVTAALQEAGIGAAELAAIGITNQRETTCLFDKDSEPLANFIVWQCRRTADKCRALREAGHSDLFRQRTGLVLDPYFSGTKMAWLLENHPHAKERIADGTAFFGTIDTWMVHRLTAGEVHITDVTNASRTLLMDLHTLEWDDELLDILHIPKKALPRICSSSEIYGHTRGLSFLPDGIPIAGIAGDQQAALFGQACFSAGEAKCTFGTGCFLLLNTGSDIVYSHSGLLTTVAAQVGDTLHYALEGAAFIAGAAVQWLRDGLGLFDDASEIEAIARTVDDTGDIVFVPALAGLGAPYWRPEARGALLGMSRDTNRGHLCRAVLEGIALQNRDILDAMREDAGRLDVLKVDGGASANDLLMQMQADLLGTPCVRPSVIETTGLGAAALAGIGVGLFSGPEAVRDVWREDRVFTPHMSDAVREQKLAKWRHGINAA